MSSDSSKVSYSEKVMDRRSFPKLMAYLWLRPCIWNVQWPFFIEIVNQCGVKYSDVSKKVRTRNSNARPFLSHSDFSSWIFLTLTLSHIMKECYKNLLLNTEQWITLTFCILINSNWLSLHKARESSELWFKNRFSLKSYSASNVSH